MAHTDSSALIDYRVAPGIPQDKMHAIIEPSAVRAVERIIIDVHGVGFDYLRRKSRKGAMVMIRYQAIYLLYVYTSLSLTSISKIFMPAIKSPGSARSSFRNIELALENINVVKAPYILTRFDKCLDLASVMSKVRMKIDSKWEIIK